MSRLMYERDFVRTPLQSIALNSRIHRHRVCTYLVGDYARVRLTRSVYIRRFCDVTG